MKGGTGRRVATGTFAIKLQANAVQSTGPLT